MIPPTEPGEIPTLDDLIDQLEIALTDLGSAIEGAAIAAYAGSLPPNALYDAFFQLKNLYQGFEKIGGVMRTQPAAE